MFSQNFLREVIQDGILLTYDKADAAVKMQEHCLKARQKRSSIIVVVASKILQSNRQDGKNEKIEPKNQLESDTFFCLF